MLFSTWLSYWKRSLERRSALHQIRRPRPAFRRWRRRLFLEVLEDRIVPSAASLASYGQLPLSFELNQGQAAAGVNYLARGSGYALDLSPTEAVLGLTPSSGEGKPAAAGNVVTLGLGGSNTSAAAVGLDKLPGVSNYFIGNDPSKWLTNIPNYGKVEYQNVYSGINLVYYGNQGQLEYDFVVAPGAGPSAIRLSVQGTDSVRLDAQGDLLLHTSGGDVVEHAPVVYQDIGGTRRSVAGRFVLEGNGQVSFRVGAYDHNALLVIDPVLVYSIYLGPNGNNRGGIAVDSSGDAYITGTTDSTNFPTTSGAFQTTYGGSGDVFVSKLNASGTALVYSTYLGGSGIDFGYAIAVDAAGDAYVTGQAGPNFPTTPGAFQTSLGQDGSGAFITKLNATGSALVYSTYLRGAGEGFGIAVDASGDAYVTGQAQLSDFPTTPNAFQTVDPTGGTATYGVAFVTKFNASGSALVYSTYVGGTTSNDDFGNAIAVGSAGNAYVGGRTTAVDFPTTPGAFQLKGGTNGGAFVTKLNATGSALVYSTYLSGTAGNDTALGIAVDATGSAYVTGGADPDFPTTDGTSGGGGFVTKLNPSGSGLVYSTFFGPGTAGAGQGIALDGSGDAYVTGSASSGFPTVDALQGYGGGGYSDAIVSELNATGSALLFSTYLGGSNNEWGYGIALDSSGNIYVTGETLSTNFPTTLGAFQTALTGTADAFVAKISLTPLPPSPSFAVAGFPSSTTAGVAHTFTVTALNANGSVNTGYTGTVRFTSSDPQAMLPVNYTFTSADQGVHTFTVTLKTAGTQPITVTDTVTYGINGNETGSVVQPAAAAKLVLSAPASVTHGVAFSVNVTLYDAYGNLATGYTGAVHFSSSDSTAILPANYTFTAADQGVHTFSGVVLRKKGKQTLNVTHTQNSSLSATDTISVN